MLTISDVAKKLVVHPKTAERFARKGYFPNAAKVGRGWRVPETDVDDYLRQNRVNAPKRPG